MAQQIPELADAAVQAAEAFFYAPLPRGARILGYKNRDRYVAHKNALWCQKPGDPRPYFSGRLSSWRGKLDRYASDQEREDDVRVFWGPDYCRLEYLAHLASTGRIGSYGLAYDGRGA